MLLFVCSVGYLYTSEDSGASWTERAAAGMRTWWGLASSSDGSKIAAGDFDTGGVYECMYVYVYICMYVCACASGV